MGQKLQNSKPLRAFDGTQEPQNAPPTPVGTGAQAGTVCSAAVLRSRRGIDTMEVYAIRAGDFVKIGIARDSVRRLAELQTGNPFPLRILFFVHVPADLAAAVEKMAHRAARKRQAQGEWFTLTDHQARHAVNKVVRLIHASLVQEAQPSTVVMRKVGAFNESYADWLKAVAPERYAHVMQRKGKASPPARLAGCSP